MDMLWQLEPKSTPIHKGPSFTQELGRLCVLSFVVEREDTYPTVRLLFDGVEAYKCTHLTSLKRDMLVAYERVVRLYETPWLLDMSSNYKPQRGNHVKEDLMHLMICFDDGPCYEFICTKFSSSEGS